MYEQDVLHQRYKRLIAVSILSTKKRERQREILKNGVGRDRNSAKVGQIVTACRAGIIGFNQELKPLYGIADAGYST